MTEHDHDASFSHLIRAMIAIMLAIALPVLLYAHVIAQADVLRVYLDALAAVVAFYFGASSSPNGAE
jgi:hypothetical protein